MDVARIYLVVCFATATLALTGVGLGQGLVLPPSHAAQPGSGATNVPFGRSTPARAQFGYDASLFGTAPVAFQTIDLRIDDGLSAAAKTVEVEVLASSLGAPVTFLQSAFANNRGADQTVVFARQLLNLPAAGTGAVPNGFDVTIPLDQSFTFDPVSGGALVIELVVYGQPPGAYTLDTTFVCDSPRADFGAPGCGPAGGPTLRAESVSSQVSWGEFVTLRVFDAQPNAVTAAMFGAQESGQWMGLDLPVDLSVIGATGCALSIGVFTTINAQADATGSALFSVFLPSQPAIVGEWIKFQGISIDPSANALGVTTSQGHKVQVCGWEPVARVYSAGVQSLTGLREIGVAPVVRLR